MRAAHPKSFVTRPWLALLGAIVIALAGMPRPASAFLDDFEDQNISDWSTTCGGWQIVPGFGGGSAVASTQFDNVLIHSTLSAGYGHYHYDVYLPNDNRADGDLIFQIVGSRGYWILLGPSNSDNVADRIIKVSNGGVGYQVSIDCAPFHLTSEVWHSIDILRFPNGVIQVFMDGEATPRLEAQETSITSAGKLALRTAVAGVRFDNVSFDSSLPVDPSPPTSSACTSWGGLLTECAVGPADPPDPPDPPGPPAPGIGVTGLGLLAGLLSVLGVYTMRRRTTLG